jgi:hypothetical protein
MMGSHNLLWLRRPWPEKLNGRIHTAKGKSGIVIRHHPSTTASLYGLIPSFSSFFSRHGKSCSFGPFHRHPAARLDMQARISRFKTV